ncbi:MAG: 2-C-methyl-D-erythritol 4-phosphate cytidylyltransferase [Oscillospiraceae bacterium]|nr:2-C-methyl-D-erythritol 4-phosphate cytidylyltransferase [Oscillospiraceae bacterium]
MVSVLVLAAGSSSRMGGRNKQLLMLEGKTVLRRSVEAFVSLPEVREILVVCRREDLEPYREVLAGLPEDKVRLLPAGGSTRQQSVENALVFLAPDTDCIAIHDGARPLVRREDIEKAFQTAQEKGSALLGVFTRDTIKVVRDGRVEASPDRSTLFLAQTPQVFRREDYLAAMAEARARGLDFTDDAQLFEQTGRPVFAVEGHADNLKITSPEDLPLAEGCLRARRDCDAENRTRI